MELGEKVLEQERYYHPSVFENGKKLGSLMGEPFRSKGGMSSFLSFPKSNFTIFQQSLLKNFPVVILFEMLSLISCLDFLIADILLFLKLRNFSQLIGVFTF